MPDNLKLPALARDFDASDIQVRAEKDKPVTIDFTLSSEREIERWFGIEVLSHEPEAIRMDRANAGAMPLLFNHDRNLCIGMINELRVEDGKLKARATLNDTQTALEVRKMIDGGLRNVSVGYSIFTVEEELKTNKITARDWEPFEGSIVTIPADYTVGLGRMRGQDDKEHEVRVIHARPTDGTPAQGATQLRTQMPDLTAAPGANGDENTGDAAGNTGNRSLPNGGPNQQQQQQQQSVLGMEKDRTKAIENLCRMNSMDETYRDYWIRSGFSVSQVTDEMLKIMEQRGKQNPQSPARIGLNRDEASRFSIMRAIHAAVEKDWKLASYELECSRAVAQQLGRVNEPTKFFVPFEVLQRQNEVPDQLRALLARRDLNTALPSAGGYLVNTDTMDFIEILRNRSVAFTMGVRRLTGLKGNVTIPKQTGSATPAWLTTETSALPESQQSFGQIALTPKTVGAYTEISRQLMMQSTPAAEGIVTDDLAKTVALAADSAVIAGTGTNGQPLGITQTTGIGTVSGGTIAYAGVIEFQTDVANSNVNPQRGGYVTTPTVAGLLMQRARFANTDTPLWNGNVWNGSVAGFPAMSSNQMAAGSMLFGDWQETVVGEWGVLEVEVNPYANFQAGIIGVRAMYSLDVGVRRPFAYSYATSIT